MWLAEEPGEDSAGGDMVGDVEDMTAVILQAGRLGAAQNLYIPAEAKTGDGGSPHSVCSTAPRRRLGIRTRRSQAQADRALEGGEQWGDRAKAGRKKQRMPPCATKPETPLAGDDAINSPALSAAMSHAVLWRGLRFVSVVERAASVSGRRGKREGKAVRGGYAEAWLVLAEIESCPGRIRCSPGSRR